MEKEVIDIDEAKIILGLAEKQPESIINENNKTASA